MVRETINPVEETKNEKVSIPDYLIYEVMDGKPIYYRGYKDVLNGRKKSADIMGYGGFQWYLLTIIGYYLKEKIDQTYLPLVGEGGLHLGHKNNLSLDLAIYKKKELKIANLKNKYFENPPRVVIEVDTKADGEFLASTNYYNKKIKLLLEFGVEKVVWIFTETAQVMVAVDNQPWLTVNWTDEIEVLGCTFSIQQVIDEAENEGETENEISHL